MDHQSAVENFKNTLVNDPDISPAVAALKVLFDVLSKDNSETVQGLEKNMKSIVKTLNEIDCSSTSVMSACELFMRFITLASLDHSDIKKCKAVLSHRANQFLGKVNSAKSTISALGVKFITDGVKILIHSQSRVVYQTLVAAHNAKKKFHVYVTVSEPDEAGRKMCDKLVEAGITCTLVLDAAVSYVLEKMDLVFLGAEGVVENGGIINKIGTYNIAISAKAMRKPVYVLAESFKFSRLCILNQRDLPNELGHLTEKATSKEGNHPLIDYTPPLYITLLLSDLGIMAPSAVSDELIKLYL